MAYGAESALRKVHFPALKGPNAPKHGAGKREGQVNVTGYIQNWNRNCPKGEELGKKETKTLYEWLKGKKGANFKATQTKGAKAMRRLRNRKEEGKKTVVKTTAAFAMD